MRNESKFLSINIAANDVLSKANQSKIKGGVLELGCPPPVGIPPSKT